MAKKVIKFDNTETVEYKFHQNKIPISINSIGINKIVVSDKLPLSKDFNYFIDYKDANKIRPLCLFFPKMSAYRRDFDESECMSFLKKDEEVLEKYNDILEKVSNIIEKEFTSEPVNNKNYLKAEKNFTTKESTQKKALSLFISNID